MNRKMVFYMLGRIMMLQSALLLLPTICAVIYSEDIKPFIITVLISLSLGFLLTLSNRTKDKTIFAKEGFVIVALAWITLSAIGSFPFVLSGEIPSFTDAFFETVSGFTTTGASILRDVEAMSEGLLFWRSFTHWIGGMGILVLIMAILPTDNGRSIHLMRAEVPGPIVGKLVPKIKSTAKILYLIYIALTLVEVVMLLLGGMNLYDSLIHSFGTAGTGGFGIKADSLAGYSSYSQWVIAIFMLIFGINFNLYFLILTGKIRSALKSEELWTYIGIVAVAVTVVAANIHSLYDNFSETLRQSAFQVSSIMTTTGFSSANFDVWPTLSKTILLVLMLVGACAGSTAGGIKVSRVVLLFKTIKANLKHLLHSRSVESIKFEGKIVDKVTLTNVTVYFAIYVICFISVLLLISFEPFSIETNISATAACFNNIGPGFAGVGPLSSYADYSDFSKWVLSVAMLLGRLEIYPVLLLFAPKIWIKKRADKKV